MAKKSKDSIPGPILLIIGLGIFFISLWAIQKGSNLKIFLVVGGVIAAYGLLKILFFSINNYAANKMIRKPKGQRKIVSGELKPDAAHGTQAHQTPHIQKTHKSIEARSHYMNQPLRSPQGHYSHNFCTNCGAPVSQGQNYCGRCGAKL